MFPSKRCWCWLALTEANGIPAASTADPFGDYSEDAWFGESGVPNAANDPIGQALQLLSKKETMGSLEMLISESYKFVRMSDDLHDLTRYINDMRLCFIVLTISGYLGVIVYAIMLCVRRQRRAGQQRRQQYLEENFQPDRPDWHGADPDLQSVRSEVPNATTFVGGRMNYRSAPAPSFMRHSNAAHNHNNQTTRLMTDSDGHQVKHQIPSIITQSAEDDITVPQLARDSLERN
uniref:Uncharacterized protein n=1 Tax=Plectus sambesii TaxID=2011161 RepID=A0A914VRW8_9BILA